MADLDASIRPPDEPDPELGAVIQRVRDLKGMTRSQLARQAGVDESDLVAIEAGVGDAVGTTVDKIASTLNTSSAELARLASVQREQVATCGGGCTGELPTTEADTNTKPRRG
jgi:transcriptional regulator with XRE-family HTH domain